MTTSETHTRATPLNAPQMDGSRISPTVGTRLAMSFVFVAMISIALVATLAIVFGDKDLSTLAAQRRADLIRSLAADGASAYNTGAPGWSDARSSSRPSFWRARRARASPFSTLTVGR